MRISAKALPANLPKLPSIPAKGRGEIRTEPIDFVAPVTFDTYLGSIPRDYDTGIYGRVGESKIRFQSGRKEASNRHGGSVDIRHDQPVLTPDGAVQMTQTSEPLVVQYPKPLGDGIRRGLLGAGLGVLTGFWGGLMASLVTANPVGMAIGAVGGALVGGLTKGVSSYRKAASERVELAWELTPIVDRNLVGYTHRVEREKSCSGTGRDQTCETETQHTYRALVQDTKYGEYYRPVVHRYQENK